MSESEQSKEPRLSPEQMHSWLQQEIKDATKALELRLSQACGLVNSFARGDISAAIAESRLIDYDNRWGDALPGTHVSEGKTDAQILAAIDSAREVEPGYHARRALKPPRGSSEPIR